MALYNVTEALVRIVFRDSFVSKHTLPCECEQCMDDILARALNRLPARYVTTNKGNAYVKAQYLDTQMQSDIVRELAMAAELVARKPQHHQDSLS